MNERLEGRAEPIHIREDEPEDEKKSKPIGEKLSEFGETVKEKMKELGEGAKEFFGLNETETEEKPKEID